MQVDWSPIEIDSFLMELNLLPLKSNQYLPNSIGTDQLPSIGNKLILLKFHWRSIQRLSKAIGISRIPNVYPRIWIYILQSCSTQYTKYILQVSHGILGLKSQVTLHELDILFLLQVSYKVFAQSQDQTISHCAQSGPLSLQTPSATPQITMLSSGNLRKAYLNNLFDFKSFSVFISAKFSIFTW